MNCLSIIYLAVNSRNAFQSPPIWRTHGMYQPVCALPTPTDGFLCDNHTPHTTKSVSDNRTTSCIDRKVACRLCRCGLLCNNRLNVVNVGHLNTTCSTIWPCVIVDLGYQKSREIREGSISNHRYRKNQRRLRLLCQNEGLHACIHLTRLSHVRRLCRT